MMQFIKMLVVVFFALELCVYAAVPHRVIRVRALSEPQTLDWNAGLTWMDGWILHNLMEGLVTINAKSEAVPALAQRWSVSSDKKTYTFYLRKGVTWSDGEPLRAQDFVASWRRVLTPETKAEGATYLYDIENAEAFNKGKLHAFDQVGVRAIGSNVLQVRLRASIAHWHWITTYFATFPVREDIIRKHPHDWTSPEHLITLGAFVLGAHLPGRSITLKRNPRYYGKRGNIDEVSFALIPDDSIALSMYEAGQVDFVPKISPVTSRKIKDHPDFWSLPDLRTFYLRFNYKHAVIGNVHLRRAIARAINREKLKEVFQGECEPAGSFVPRGVPGYDPAAGQAFNAASAREELKAAKVEASTFPPIKILAQTTDEEVALARFIEEELRSNLKLTAATELVEPNRFYSGVVDHSAFPLEIQFWSADFPDPDNFFSVFLSSEDWSSYRWKDPRYDSLVLEARSLSDSKSRLEHYSRAQKILLEDDAVTLPLCYGHINGLMRKSIGGFNPGPMSWWQLKGLNIK